MTKLSQVQQVLIQQIEAQVPGFMDKYGVKTLVVDDDDNKLKFCLRPRGVVVNLIIAYNSMDTYDIEGWTIDGVDFWKSYELPGAYAEMLPDAFKGAIDAGRDKTQKRLANALITHSVEAKTHDLSKWR